MNINKGISLVYYISFIVFIVWTILIAMVSFSDISVEKQKTIELARKEALTIYHKDLAFRYWATSHGGVYVPISEKTKPNQYLTNVKEREITTPSGKKLTLMNPAYMLRQVMSDYNDLYGLKGHITSLNVLNPQNEPDDWERSALEKFESGTKEVFDVDESGKEPYLRLIKPLITKDGCLKCHAHQGYKVGDIRGGISISLLMEPYLLFEKEAIREIIKIHLLFWVVGVIFLLVFTLWGKIRVSELKSTQDKLKKSENEFRSIIENSPVPMVIVDQRGDILSFNIKFESLLGYTIDDIATAEKWWTNVYPDPVYRKKVKSDWEKAVERSQATGKEIETQEWDMSCKNGSKITVEFNLMPLKEMSVIVINDITKRKRAEEERIRLEVAIEQTAESILITDMHGNIQYVNPSFEQISGYSRKEVLGKNPRFLKSDQHNAAFYKNMWDTLSKSKVWKGHIINKKKNGDLFEEEVTISAVFDKVGNIINYVSVKRDVTREIEIAMQLRQSQKMEAIGTLAGGIAHDFNNILAVILGYTEILIDDAPPDSNSPKYLEKILTASNRAKDLVKQILAFSRQAEIERVPLRLQSLIKEALKMMRSSIPATIKIQDNIDSKCGVVLVDPTQIHQILMNLCTNANHAMVETGGILKIELKSVYVDKDNRQLELNINPGEYVELVVSDTGSGINPNLIDKIFNPYFTTKEVGKGTGMGLAIIHGIIGDYGGSITVESELGKGTTFHVFFPVIEQEAFPILKNIDKVPLGKGRILFVDDEELLAEMGKDILELLGYTVTVRQNSLDALSTFQNCPEDFDVIITDQTMPGMTGSDLAQRILQIRPDIPIILCTGYSNLINESKAKALGIREFALKPLTKISIAKLLRKVLDAS